MSALGSNSYQDAGDGVGSVLAKLYESGSALNDMRERHASELKRAIEFAAAKAYALGFEAGFVQAKEIAGDSAYRSSSSIVRLLPRAIVKLIRGEDA